MGRSGSELGMLHAGLCDQLATIEKKTVTKDTVGGDVPTWAAHTTAWVWLKPFAMSKNSFAQQLRPTLTHVIYTPYFTSPAMTGLTLRVVLGSRYFNIQGIPTDIDEAHEFWKMSVVEGTANT